MRNTAEVGSGGPPYLKLLDFLQGEAPQRHRKQVIIAARGDRSAVALAFLVLLLLDLGRAVLGERLVALGLQRLDNHRLLLVVDDDVCVV